MESSSFAAALYDLVGCMAGSSRRNAANGIPPSSVQSDTEAELPN